MSLDTLANIIRGVTRRVSYIQGRGTDSVNLGRNETESLKTAEKELRKHHTDLVRLLNEIIIWKDARENAENKSRLRSDDPGSNQQAVELIEHTIRMIERLLDVDHYDSPKLFTTKQTAELVDWTQTAVELACWQGKIRIISIEGKKYIPEDEVRRLLRLQRHNTLKHVLIGVADKRHYKNGEPV